MCDVHCLPKSHHNLSCSLAHIIASSLEVPLLASSHYMRLPKAPLLYMACSSAMVQHTTARHAFTRIRCHNWSATLRGLCSTGHQSLLSLQGLRTLVLGTKVLSEEVWADWDSRYQDAAAQLDNRDEALAALAVEIEADLEFVGVTAIEDKLQEGVPAAIQSLLDAGMKVSACW